MAFLSLSLPPIPTLRADFGGFHGAGWTLEPRTPIDGAAATPEGQPERDTPDRHPTQSPRLTHNDACRLTPCLDT